MMKYLAALSLAYACLFPNSALAKHHHRHTIDANGNSTQIIGGSPAGCPRTNFCACALRKIYGIRDASFNQARRWLRFPRTSPHPGAVAVHSHHVFQLREHIAGDVWLVYDANSGGHLTRIHPRSIAGWSIVDPRARASL